MNLIAALVRGKPVAEALTLLKFTPKRSAPILAKLIQSAAANAENNFKQDPENLVISRLIVDAGVTFKRGRPISRGRWHPLKKRTSHVSVELTVVEKPKTAPKKTVAASAKKTPPKSPQTVTTAPKKVAEKVPPKTETPNAEKVTETAPSKTDTPKLENSKLPTLNS